MGPPDIGFSHFANNGCNNPMINGGSVTLPGPAYVQRVLSPTTRTLAINYGVAHPFGPNWAYCRISATRAQPINAPIPANPFKKQYIRVYKERAANSWVPWWFPELVPPRSPIVPPQAIPYRAIPEIQPSGWPEAPERGNSLPRPAPNADPAPMYWAPWWMDFDYSWWPSSVTRPATAPSRPATGAPPKGPPPVRTNPPTMNWLRMLPEFGPQTKTTNRTVEGISLRVKGSATNPTKSHGKEKKIKSDKLGRLLTLAAMGYSTVDDYKDYVNALHKALPKSCQDTRKRSRSGRRGGRTTSATYSRVGENQQVVAKVKAISRCWGSMDWPMAVQNLAREVMQDILGAGADAMARRAAINARIAKTQVDTRAPGVDYRHGPKLRRVLFGEGPPVMYTQARWDRRR